MKVANYLAVLLMASVGIANAADVTTDKPAESKKAHAHKKCAEKNDKSCHLHKPAASAASAAVTAPVVEKAPEVNVTAALSDDDGRELAKKNGCFMCHAVEKKVVGPAWRDVAAKYRNDASAEAMLVTKVSKGGKGTWGSMAMPANAPRVSDDDIKALVKFVLNLK